MKFWWRHGEGSRLMMNNEEKQSCCCASRSELATKPLEKLQEKIKPKQETSLEDMVYLAGGKFQMGTNDKEGFPSDGEGPIREVAVKPFYMDKFTVTNVQFAKFVEATHYRTEAEVFGWSFVF